MKNKKGKIWGEHSKEEWQLEFSALSLFQSPDGLHNKD